jgi:hypothetical protein
MLFYYSIHQRLEIEPGSYNAVMSIGLLLLQIQILSNNSRLLEIHEKFASIRSTQLMRYY